MHPTHTHLIKYKNKYLGKNNYVFAFIKESHAKQVADKLRYASPVLKVSPHTFVINRKVPVNQGTHKKLSVIDKQQLEIEKLQTSVGGFFTAINNMEIKVIDEVLVSKNSDAIVLKSEFELEEMVPLEPYDMIQHLNVLYHKPIDEHIDYAHEMSKIIIDRYIDAVDDDDENYLED